MTWKTRNSEICSSGQMAIINFISTQLVHTYPQHTHTHTHPTLHFVYNCNTASSLHPVLHFFCRKRRLSYEVFSDKRLRKPPNTASKPREKEVDADWVYQFFLHWFETDSHRVCCPSHRQWDIALYSGSKGSDSNWMSITHYDWPCSAMRECLNHLHCRSEFRTKLWNV